MKLSREEVIAKYSPTPDPLWTAEVNAKFFANLPANSPRQSVSMGDEKEMLIRDFAKVALRAGRLRDGYVSTLGGILGLFADADLIGGECLVSQRDNLLGTAKTLRTIQAQMLRSGHLVRETRPQGHGFVGEVLVYSPLPIYRHRPASADYLERAYRNTEGVSSKLSTPVNLSPEDVPY
jgi:hypothetical protein